MYKNLLAFIDDIDCYGFHDDYDFSMLRGAILFAWKSNGISAAQFDELKTLVDTLFNRS